MEEQLGAHEACCKCAGVDAHNHALEARAMLWSTRDKAEVVGMLQCWAVCSVRRSTLVVEASWFGQIAALLIQLELFQSSFEPACEH